MNKINNPDNKDQKLALDYSGILKLLPHRYPFLFVDGILEFEKEKSIVGYKNFSFNDNFFQGHFPQEPVAPGVIQIEALAQVSCILMALSFDDVAGKRPAFAAIDEAKFKQPVRPGDTLKLVSHLDKYRRGLAIFKTQGFLGEDCVTEAIIKATMV